MNRRLKTILSLALAAALCGCFKEVGFDCRYNLRPYLQAESGGETVVAEGAIAYAFMADTTLWTVASYDDALNGVLTSKADGSKRSDYASRAEQSAEDGTIVLQLDGTPATIIAVDAVDSIYGWRMTEVTENVPELYVSVTFRPWTARSYYIEGAWRMVNEFYTPEPEEPDEGEEPAGPPNEDVTE